MVFADIGTSVYYAPGILYGRVGTRTALFIAMTLVVFVLLAIKYAEVAIRYPGGGGVVTVASRVVADTRDAITLREAGYPAVHYVPRKDVDMALLERTEHATYCPYKGDCSYFSVPLGGDRSKNAAWTYEAPYPAVTLIKDHVAFYPDRVDAIEERQG